MNRKKILFILPMGILLLGGILFLALRINKVHVESGKYYTDQQIIQSVMSDNLSYHTLYLFAKSKLKDIPCLPFVQEIEIEWNGPDEITLHVYDKMVSGCVNYMGQYVYFDQDGIVLQSMDKKIKGIPVIKGIQFKKFVMNERFEVDDTNLFDVIMNLSQLISHYKIPVEQIEFKGENVILYSGDVTVNLGQKDFYDDDMAALSSVLKKAKKHQLSGTIDMTYFEEGDKIILKTGNASEDPTATASPEDSETAKNTTEGETESDDNWSDAGDSTDGEYSTEDTDVTTGQENEEDQSQQNETTNEEQNTTESTEIEQ